ncbi:MAG: twin-arginine translocase subunit TatB [Proteobacteria bacterium]|jgi:sec-independent protein translocase protein TatB|nr:twin-arginine translocase subunit TatB [Pseudomonadota bacterium]
MFDIGFWELCVIGAVLLLVIGPERMPEVAKQIGYWTTRARRTVNQLRNEMRSELNSLPTEQINKAKQSMDAISKDVASMGSDLSAKMSEKIEIKESPEKPSGEKLTKSKSTVISGSNTKTKSKKKPVKKATASAKNKDA